MDRYGFGIKKALTVVLQEIGYPIKAQDAIIALVDSGGGDKGTIVGHVDENTSSFPTTRPNGSPLVIGDYVSPSATANIPFTVKGITFTTKYDRAVWDGTKWTYAAGDVVESNEIVAVEPDKESISGTANYQNEINKEIKAKVTDIQSLINVLDEEYKKAGFKFSATTTTTDGIDKTVLNVKDKNDHVLLNIDLMGAMTGQELLDAIKDLPAELTNKIIDCGTFNPVTP